MKNSSTRSKLILLVVVSALPALALTLYSALEERALNLAGIALATILLLLGAWYGTEVFVLILRRTKTSVPYHAPRRSRIVASAMPARLRARSSSALYRVRASAGSAETTTRRISLLRVLKFFIPVPCGILGPAAVEYVTATPGRSAAGREKSEHRAQATQFYPRPLSQGGHGDG